MEIILLKNHDIFVFFRICSALLLVAISPLRCVSCWFCLIKIDHILSIFSGASQIEWRGASEVQFSN